MIFNLEFNSVGAEIVQINKFGRYSARKFSPNNAQTWNPTKINFRLQIHQAYICCMPLINNMTTGYYSPELLDDFIFPK